MVCKKYKNKGLDVYLQGKNYVFKNITINS